MHFFDWIIVGIFIIALVVIAKIVRELVSIVLGFFVTIFIAAVVIYLLLGMPFLSRYENLVLGSKIGALLYALGKISVVTILAVFGKFVNKS